MNLFTSKARQEANCQAECDATTILLIERLLTAARCLGKEIEITDRMRGNTDVYDVDPRVTCIRHGRDQFGRWVVYVPFNKLVTREGQQKEIWARGTLVVSKTFADNSSLAVTVCHVRNDNKRYAAQTGWLDQAQLFEITEFVIKGSYTAQYSNGLTVALETSGK